MCYTESYFLRKEVFRMERVLVIGCPGAGKTTLSTALSEKLGLPLVNLDRLHWRPGWTEAPQEEFDALLTAELEKPRWIIDGNYSRTLPLRLKYCDRVIFLDFGRLRCTLGVLKRVITNHGRSRPDMGDGCPERFDAEFMRYVWGFNGSQRGRLLAALEGADAEVTVLKNRREVRRFLENI